MIYTMIENQKQDILISRLLFHYLFAIYRQISQPEERGLITVHIDDIRVIAISITTEENKKY